MIFYALVAALVLLPIFAALLAKPARETYERELAKVREEGRAAEEEQRTKLKKLYGKSYSEAMVRSRYIYGYSVTIDRPWGAAQRFWTMFAITAVALAGYTGITSIVLTFPQAGSYVGEAYASRDLVALDTGMQTSARRYLFSGYYGEYPAFSFLERDANGGIHAGTQYAYKSTVYEGDYEPSYVSYPCVNTIPLLVPWSVTYGDVHAFYVPEGSVTSDFSVTTPFEGEEN